MGKKHLESKFAGAFLKREERETMAGLRLGLGGEEKCDAIYEKIGSVCERLSKDGKTGKSHLKQLAEALEPVESVITATYKKPLLQRQHEVNLASANTFFEIGQRDIAHALHNAGIKEHETMAQEFVDAFRHAYNTIEQPEPEQQPSIMKKKSENFLKKYLKKAEKNNWGERQP